MSKYTINNKIDEKTMNIPVFDGFYYFAPFDFEKHAFTRGSRFIVAIDTKTNQIIGVMKIKRYNLVDHSFVPESKKDEIPHYIAILYVDVHRSWKQRGIATALYKELNKQITKPNVICGTALSKEGKLAKLDQLRKRIITNAESFDSFDEMNTKTLGSQYY